MANLITIIIERNKTMCDMGLALGIAAGAAQAAGQASTADKNRDLIKKQANLEYATQEREFLVEADASNKDAYQAALEGDRAQAIVKASGAGMQGLTAGLRSAEQSRQSALSIANAKDRSAAAGANYALAGKNTQIGATNRIATEASLSPLNAFSNIATAGLDGYGKFRK
ncbi:hypothetical protein [Mesorhizobium sp. CN2-181]|uniref:hypothetical protein n=1 Tax=Mesorhizobium yinganensis TaxID=3157707 RepID=UPI0032B7AFB9